MGRQLDSPSQRQIELLRSEKMSKIAFHGMHYFHGIKKNHGAHNNVGGFCFLIFSLAKLYYLSGLLVGK